MCMVDYADERALLLSDVQRKARKEHVCNECARKIQRGEFYRHEVTKYDGDVSTHKTCSHCEVVRDWLSAECGGWLYGGVEEDIREHFEEGYGLAIGRLAAGMRRCWTRTDGRLMEIPKCPETTHDKIGTAQQPAATRPQ